MKKRIPGFNNYDISVDGQVTRTKSGRPLKPSINNCGYLKVWLYKDKKRHEKFVHKLLLECFVEKGNKSFDQGNHKNGIKTDNRLQNLEWCNNSINQLHAYREGLNGHHRLDEIQKKTIISCYNSGIPSIKLARYFKVSIPNIYNYVQSESGGEIHS